MKRYEIKYGDLRVYDVVKETDKFFTFQRKDTWSDRTVETRQSKAGTFPSLRECLEDAAKSLDHEVARLASKLDLKRKNLAKVRDILGRSDDKLEQAVEGLKLNW